MRNRYRRALSAVLAWNERRRALSAGGDADAPELRAPTFIVGSPRSGTTLLGELLGEHPDVAYVNEPHWLWGAIDPRADTIGWRLPPKQARLRLEASDASPEQARRARAALACLAAHRGKSRLVEKTPDNSLRIPWLLALFPDARFVHILRDPHATALSLQRALARWFPQGWRGTPQEGVWLRHCASEPQLAGLWASARDDYERGLLVWREENRLAAADAAHLGKTRYAVVRYEDLVSEPAARLDRLLEEIDLEPAEACRRMAADRVRGDAPVQPPDPALLERLVGAALLDAFGYRFR